MKIIGIIENNPITGVKYGEIEVTTIPTYSKYAVRCYQSAHTKKMSMTKKRMERTKQK